MKKRTLFAVTFLSLSSCLVLNETGLNPGHITGDEAADRILNAVVVTHALTTAAMFGKVYLPEWTFIADILAGIDRDKYYKESEVDDCVKDISRLKYPETFFGSTYVAIKCKLQPDNMIFDP